MVVDLSDSNPTNTIIFEYKVNIFVIDLEEYNISNDNTNATSTTNGINQALIDANTKGYSKVQLPAGHYAIDTSVKNPIVLTDGTNTWTHNRQGISMQSDMELILEDAILEIVPCEDPYYSILTISNCTNSKITGGTILGDRDTHDYGMRINENGDEFEIGSIDETTGELISNSTCVRTINYIDGYIDWFTKQKTSLPTGFNTIPLWNTTKNSVDGGKKRIYCYDENNKYLGVCDGYGFAWINLLQNTKKIKIVILNETRLYAAISLTKRTLYQSYEFGASITVADSNNIEINGTTIEKTIGDCIYTLDVPLKVTVDNLKILNCDISNSRRQGISLVSSGENYLISGCKIHDINGIDPQSGIDIEHYRYVNNVTIENNTFYNNRKLDIINYNGTSGIIIRNNKFNGAIGATYGSNMEIYNNILFYKHGVNDSNMLVKDSSIVLSTSGNKIYNNQLTNCRYNTSESSISYGNSITNGTVTINSNQLQGKTQDKYYNCTINFNKTSNFSFYENGYFENCIIGCSNNSYSIEVRNSIFNNSNFDLRGISIATNCTFNLVDKTLISSVWKVTNTNLNFNDCIITSKSKVLPTGINPVKMTFSNCTITTNREEIFSYPSIITFNDCYIKFTDEDVKLGSKWNTGNTDVWYFNNCIFDSVKDITIGGNIVNPTIIGNVKIV